MLTIDRLLETATDQHRAGNLGEARRLYGVVLANEPAHTLALFRSGLLELQEQHPEAALDMLLQAAAQMPAEPRYHFAVGRAFHMLRRWAEAEAAYREVLRLDPRSADAHCALGVVLLLNGQLRAAAAAYGDALELRPGDVVSLGGRGAVLRELGDLDQAVALLTKATILDPAEPAHAINLGIALCQRRDFAEAEIVLRKALVLGQRRPEAAFNLGNALQGLGRLAEAAEQYRSAVGERPDYPEAWNNLGNVYRSMGLFRPAESAFDAALAVDPNDVVALNNLGCLLRVLGRSDAAEDTLRRGLRVNPSHAALLDNLGSVLKDAGALNEAIACFRASLNIAPGNPDTHSNLAYALSFQCADPAPILEQCREWNRCFAASLAGRAATMPCAEHAGRRLRIGYVSADFRDHCQSLFMVPLLAHHDHSRVEVFCYSSVERPDEMTRRLASHADVWRDVRSLTDAELDRVIREDAIDVLVDLTMHMADNRLLAFARKPAPVQIAWLAYPGTTGIDAMDFRLSDPRLDPPGYDHHYSERTLRLPDSFWCYHPLTDVPQVGPLPALARGYVTFGCLNNPCKISTHTLRLWGEVMRRLPTSRLTVMAPEGRHREHLLRRLDAHAIAAERVNPLGFRPRAEYLASYGDIDLALDTLPYNGHTTSLDACWMGVPTVSRVGATSVGRGGLSQLHQLDLRELAADTDEGFIATAVNWALDLGRLATLRQRLRQRLEASPLMDAARFARHIETAYSTAVASVRRKSCE